MKTIRLFREDVDLKTATAIISKIDILNGKIRIVTDQTIFFPTGGGQSCDTGYIDDIEIVDVYEEDGYIYHVSNSETCKLKPGDSVKLSINWDRRFDNMQRHCGEHITSGKFYELCGGVNRGFHMGDNYMTIDISLEDDPSYSELTWDMCKEVELRTNKVIWQNLPIISRHFDKREEAESLPLRKKLSLDEDITIVSVGDINNPADCVACCGTHPKFSGQVGLVKILKLEPNKGMYRVYLEAGKRAFLNYQREFDLLKSAEDYLSAGDDDLMDKLEKKDMKIREHKDKIRNASSYIVDREIKGISDALSYSSDKVIICRHDILSDRALGEIGKRFLKMPESATSLLVLLSTENHSASLFSKAYDCGGLVKRIAPSFSGRGGGGKNNAHVSFNSMEEADSFGKEIDKEINEL